MQQFTNRPSFSKNTFFDKKRTIFKKMLYICNRKTKNKYAFGLRNKSTYYIKL